MPENIKKILGIIKESMGCQHDCSNCMEHDVCEYAPISKALIDAGVVIPVLCKECAQFDPDLGICKIRHDSYGNVLERGPHDWCSDGNRK